MSLSSFKIKLPMLSLSFGNRSSRSFEITLSLEVLPVKPLKISFDRTVIKWSFATGWKVKVDDFNGKLEDVLHSPPDCGLDALAVAFVLSPAQMTLREAVMIFMVLSSKRQAAFKDGKQSGLPARQIESTAAW